MVERVGRHAPRSDALAGGGPSGGVSILALARGGLKPLHLDISTGHARPLNGRGEPAVVPDSPGDISDAVAVILSGNQLECPIL
jgi:hypothetical protein